MRFLFQNKEYTFPTSLSQITLGKRIEFHELYGREISETIGTLQDEGDQADLLEQQLSAACKAFSFFSGIPLEEVFKIPFTQVLGVYHSCLKTILEEQEDIDLQTKYLWGDKIWLLEHPQLSYESNMTFNEFIVSKQVTKQMQDLGAGRWEALPYLCAIFLRGEDESFDEGWMTPDSERIKLMHELPLDIALSVGFFLKCSMNMSLKASASSAEEVEKVQT